MTIDFQCTKCNAQMSSPDGTSGKKGRCPSCGEIQQIPGTQQSAPAATNDTITLSCSSCGDELTVPASHAGKKGRCPSCQTVNQIPGGSGGGAAPAASSSSAPTDGNVTFNCEHCDQQVTVPKSTAGKKGRCPGCSKVVLVPGGSKNKPVKKKKSDGFKLVGTDATLVNGKLTFACSKCAQSITVPEAVAGKKGKCPQCSEVIGIPAAPAPKSTPAATAPATSNEPIQFRCPSCNRLVKTPGISAGKKGKCPGCQSVFDIPMTSTVTPQTPAPSGLTPVNSGGLTPVSGSGLTPVGDGAAPVSGNGGLTPVSSSGLTPVGPTSGGLTPVGGGGGLTPVDSTGGLTPVAPAPMPMDGSGLTPVGPASGGLTPVGGGLTPAPAANPYMQDSGAGIPNVGDPLGIGGLGSASTTMGAGLNSYPAPTATSHSTGRRGRKKSTLVQVTAGIMMAVCGLFILLRLGMVVIFLVSGSLELQNSPLADNQDAMVLGGLAAALIGGLALFDGALLFGYYQMFIGRRYAFAIISLIGSIFLHVFPGCCCTGFYGLPLNIVAVIAVIVGFVALLMDEGKRSFVD